jgi:hypothetical protein
LTKLRRLYLDLWWWGSNDFIHSGLDCLVNLKHLCLWDSKHYIIDDICQMKELTILFICHPTFEALEKLAANLKKLKTLTFSVEASHHIAVTSLVCKIFPNIHCIQVLFPVDMETVCTRVQGGKWDVETRTRVWPRHKLTTFSEFDPAD